MSKSGGIIDLTAATMRSAIASGTLTLLTRTFSRSHPGDALISAEAHRPRQVDSYGNQNRRLAWPTTAEFR